MEMDKASAKLGEKYPSSAKEEWSCRFPANNACDWVIQMQSGPSRILGR